MKDHFKLIGKAVLIGPSILAFLLGSAWLYEYLCTKGMIGSLIAMSGAVSFFTLLILIGINEQKKERIKIKNGTH